MLKKSGKIYTVVCTSEKDRRIMIAKLAVELGFAVNVSDAQKIIRPDPRDYDLHNTFFVIAATYNLKESMITTSRLYEMAAKGFCVIIGVKKIPPELEFICEPFYASDFGIR